MDSLLGPIANIDTVMSIKIVERKSRDLSLWISYNFLPLKSNYGNLNDKSTRYTANQRRENSRCNNGHNT